MIGSSLRLALVSGSALAALVALPGTAAAQTQTEGATPEAATPTGAATPQTGAAETDAPVGKDILVTGSRIKQDPNNSALPLQIITNQELSRNGISSPEQLVAFLTTNGTGGDNLASNSDVVSGAQRGNNGASFANLRGQGSGSTLVLLNGRRVAAHGLSGAAVDVNQIPFAAIERVEILKDGASAIYGTDAIGGVINFITRKDYRGFGLQSFVDVTELGDSPIYRLSGIAGFGNLDDQGFNVMAAVGYSWVKALRGDQRKFVNTYQSNRGLSPDTRGTPFGTIFPLAGTALTPTNGALYPIPDTTTPASGGINVLDLPGGAGCGVIPGQAAYDDVLWANATARYACAYDTGRAARLQQPIDTLTYLGRAVKRFGAHEVSLEVTGSRAKSAKTYSEIQLTPNTTTQNYALPASSPYYAPVFNALVATFPLLATQRGLPLAYRWRCIECGPRQIFTKTDTFRAALNVEGPIVDGWDYRVGGSYSESKSDSTFGTGFYYRDTVGSSTGLIDALRSGVINPFLFPGQTQTPAALALIAGASAAGTDVFGGKYSVRQFDGSVSGSIFDLPAGTVKLAAGVDYRKEKFSFDNAIVSQPRVVLSAPTDETRYGGASREIKAAYAELLVPIISTLELSAAARIDDYSGFGTTTNPKVSLKYRPWEPLLLRASYNTGFRVPTFNQLFNNRTDNPYTGRDFPDPSKCPTLVVSTTNPACAVVSNINLTTGGNPGLGPETAKMASAGIVFQPSSRFSATLDYWTINRENTIQLLTLQQLFSNYAQFADRFVRDGAGNIVSIDQTTANAGSTRTQALEVALRGNTPLFGGVVSAGLDGTYLLKKKEKLVEGVPYRDLVGEFSFSGDLGLRWKHNAFVSYTNDEVTVSLTQIFRDGYRNQQLPGVASGLINPPDDIIKVADYTIYNLSVGYTGVKGMLWTFGIRNLFDRDPPFAVAYDSASGGGSSWEPRVADPRGRSYTMAVEVRF